MTRGPARLRQSPSVSQQQLMISTAHDLQQPLTVLHAGTQIMQRRLERGEEIDPRQLQQWVCTINASANKLRRMVGELLDVARQDAGAGLALAIDSVDVSSLVHQLVIEHRMVFPRHEFTFNSLPSTVIANVDADRVERIVSNMLSNAAKYSPCGSVVNATVSLYGKDCEWAVVSVHDQGVGIPDSDIAHVFDRFYRASNVRTQKPGTGLGLWGAQAIAAMHGGSITVESTEGVGSIFALRLPVGIRSTA